MLLVSKYVVPVTAPFIEDGAVLVRGDEIADIGTAEELKAKYPDEPVKDLGLAALSPGFVDAHTHLGYTALRGMFEDMPYAEWKRAVLRCEPFFTDADWVNSARLGALEAIASGITTVSDITIPDATVTAINEAGLRAVIYREAITMHADQAEAAVNEAFADIEAWKGHTNGDRVTFGVAAGPIYATHPKVFKEIARRVGDSDFPVAMHLAGSQEEYDFIRYGSSPFSVHASEASQGMGIETPPWLPAGVNPVRYVYNWDILDLKNILIIHGVHVDEDDLGILKKNNVSVAHCPRINAKLGMGAAPVNEMLKLGINVALGTDSPAAVDTTDMIDEMRVSLLINRAFNGGKKGQMTTEKMLRMATIDSAKALRLDDKVGSLEIGKKADIIAIDLHNSHQNPTSNPASAIIYTANQDNVKMTMVAGEILYDDFVHRSNLQRDDIVRASRDIRSRVRHGMNDEDLRERVIKRMEEDRAERLKR